MAVGVRRDAHVERALRPCRALPTGCPAPPPSRFGLVHAVPPGSPSCLCNGCLSIPGSGGGLPSSRVPPGPLPAGLARRPHRRNPPGVHCLPGPSPSLLPGSDSCEEGRHAWRTTAPVLVRHCLCRTSPGPPTSRQCPWVAPLPRDGDPWAPPSPFLPFPHPLGPLEVSAWGHALAAGETGAQGALASQAWACV